MSFLVDTDICSAYLKGNRAVNNRFLQYTGGLYISTVTLAELYTWTLRSSAPPRHSQSLLELLRDVATLDVTQNVARKFGEVRAALLDQGLPPPDLDMLIAATALVHDFTLVTHNTQDFTNVPGLRLMDWTVP
ncbi:MAG TPA: type II toxin-antitoxin system VapC family toxin [Tepidisphaeraceae bacterium]|jgi:tRNA(fMet)-specific endonuclease VapC|nr:type II toxin-antitoxin system VapC family toxin [Tepidisphaeraceae bacterium]